MAVLLAGLPVSVPATTVNRLCGSSLDATMMASRAIETGDAEVVVAGGVESMTRAPWVLPKPSRAFPAGNVTAVSTTLGWRLVNERMPAEWTVSLGEANEQLAEAYGITRERQDAFAARSHHLADAAWDAGFYDDLVVAGARRRPGARRGHPARQHRGEARRAQARFRPDGTITPGNASPLNDGASALLLGSGRRASTLGLEPHGPDRGPRVVRPRAAAASATPPSRPPDRAAARGHHLGRRRRGRAQRGVRRPVARLRRRLAGPGARPTASSSTPRAARSPSATRSAPRAPASSAPWPSGCASRGSAGAWPRSASASARASPSCWRTSGLRRAPSRSRSAGRRPTAPASGSPATR